MFLSIILLIFSIILLFFGVFFVIWWKNYGKSIYFMLKNVSKHQKTPFDLKNLENLEQFHRNMSNFGGQSAYFDPKIKEILNKMGKKGSKKP